MPGIFVAWLSLLLLWGNYPTPALAQGAVLEPRVEANFPASITFKLRAEAPAEITKVALNIWVDRISPFEEVVECQPTFTSDKKVEVSWTWDMRKVGGLPPGTSLSYSWTVHDASGGRWQTEKALAQFDDQRYRWRMLEQDKVSLFWYEGDEAFARQLLQAALEALEKLRQDTGTELEKGAKIYIYNGAMALRDARIFPQVWEAGTAFPDYGITAIGISPDQLSWGERTVAHELAHLLSYQVTYSPYSDIPTWLDEGLAMHTEGELAPELATALRKTGEQGLLFSVKTLSSSFPADPSWARLAYYQSHSLVEFLIKSRGRDSMRAFLQAFRDGLAWEEALERVYGLDAEGLDRAWREYLWAPATPAPLPTPTPSPRPVPGLVSCSCQAGSGSGIDLGSLLVLLLPLALILRRQKNI